MTYLKPLKDLVAGFSDGSIQISDIVADSLRSIKEREDLNAFCYVFADSSTSKSRRIQEQIEDSQQGPLAGMVVALKDNICYEGHPCSASSQILEGFVSPYSATAVDRLVKADATLIGANNCDEFGMGSSNENSKYGPVKNPHDQNRVAGGSSGGGAAAVASGLCHVALGSDTGGSVRQPAAFCGVIGLKPTYGRVSRYGLMAYASSFDTIGILGSDLYEMALTLETISGFDPNDSTSSNKNVPQFSAFPTFENKSRIAVLDQTLENQGIDAEVKRQTEEIISLLRDDGNKVDFVSMPILDYALPCYYVLACAEASSNLSRYDGIRMGPTLANATSVQELIRLNRGAGFGDEVIRRIVLGTFVLSSGYVDAYYKKAQDVRRTLSHRLSKLFQEYDFIIGPTTPTTAFKLEEMESDPISMYKSDLLTVPASLAGLPAISIPIGQDAGKLPIGLQITAPKFEEISLFSLSQQILQRSN